MPTIDHVVVLVLENRSFDHMLGYLPHPSADFDGLGRGGPYENPGFAGGPATPATPHAKRVLPVGPDHSHDAVIEQLALRGMRRLPTNQGFVSSYEAKARGLDPPAFGGLLGALATRLARRKADDGAVTGRGPLVMLCQPPEQVPVLVTLAKEFAVCTRWFCSVPGETWPNRNFVHAATSDGETNIVLRPYTNPTIFELLEQRGHSWHIYHDDTPQVWAFPNLWDSPERHANWFPLADFARHVATGELPAYSFLEPNHRPPLHTLDHAPIVGRPDVSNSQHPENNLVSNDAYDTFTGGEDSDFARAESLLATVYEALRANPDLFRRTVLLITYDEHGGLYDHVPPATGVPAPGPTEGGRSRFFDLLLRRTSAAFDFTMLGPRVPAVVVSPYVPAGTVDARLHDHACVPATLRAIFTPDAPALTDRDRWAGGAPFHSVLTLGEARGDLPDLSRYVVPAPVAATGEPLPAATGEPLSAAAAPTAAAPPSDAVMPHYYRAFVGLADDVQRHLVEVGEPEAIPPSHDVAAGRAAEITESFRAAASRHRAEQSGRRRQP